MFFQITPMLQQQYKATLKFLFPRNYQLKQLHFTYPFAYTKTDYNNYIRNVVVEIEKFVSNQMGHKLFGRCDKSSQIGTSLILQNSSLHN